MHIFIDESGAFTGYHAGSIGAVGALVIPDSSMAGIRRKYARIRPSLPKENGEVKGRKIENARDVNRIVRILYPREVLFEVTAIDFGLHTEAGVIAYKQKLITENRAGLANFPEPLRAKVATAVDALDNMAPPQFIQALTTFELVHRVICHSILYFAQRRPYELSSFSWVADGKEPGKVTNWENWLAFYAQGALISLSKRDPVPMPQPGEPYLFNYTFLDRLRRTEPPGDNSLDPARLLKNFKFKSDQDMGVEFVDVLANATRRLLRDDLEREGWVNMHRMMIDRPDSYIKFILYGPGPDVTKKASYGAVVNEGFRKSGKPMFTRRNDGYEKKTQGS